MLIFLCLIEENVETLIRNWNNYKRERIISALTRNVSNTNQIYFKQLKICRIRMISYMDDADRKDTLNRLKTPICHLLTLQNSKITAKRAWKTHNKRNKVISDRTEKRRKIFFLMFAHSFRSVESFVKLENQKKNYFVKKAV